MQQFQERMDVISNNIANVNTTAFKSARTEFAESFSQTLKSASASNGTSTGTGAIQIGSGVSTATIRNLFTQGAIGRTGVATDLGIAGDGFFVVKDMQSGIQYATRAGEFRIDDQGYVVTDNGMRVQGFSDAALATRGDLKVDETGKPASAAATAKVSSFNIDKEGKINVRLDDGSEFVRGQVLLQKFNDPQLLMKEGNNLFSGISVAGPLGGSAAPAGVPPGTSGTGSIQSGALELSNVDLANEFTSLITTQRSFQASAKIISTSDEILQELVNLKR